MREFRVQILDDESLRITEVRGPWDGGNRIVVLSPDQIANHRIEWVRELQNSITGNENE